uniref:Uncharacterized protein n=1 Tax=Cacopsylla melanoneura TaxID=428564 RepID=A0A8D8WKB0_9HEMI
MPWNSSRKLSKRAPRPVVRPGAAVQAVVRLVDPALDPELPVGHARLCPVCPLPVPMQKICHLQCTSLKANPNELTPVTSHSSLATHPAAPQQAHQLLRTLTPTPLPQQTEHRNGNPTSSCLSRPSRSTRAPFWPRSLTC